MIKPEQIPDEAARALINAITMLHKSPHESLAAALNAWPDAKYFPEMEVFSIPPRPAHIILPLPKEGEQ